MYFSDQISKMFFRVLFSFFMMITYTSCKDVLTNKDNGGQVLDTLVNFTKVDTSPYFKVCENLLDEAKTNCFRMNVHKQITKHLQSLNLSFEEEEAFEMTVVLTINNTGNVSLKNILCASTFNKEVAVLKREINLAISNLPKLNPALKRGIPVATEYKLPIKIKTID